ncbi:hypothetical protein F4809DRAFT_656016 [Biscogniauxia mediterranea]|nr:hypothetical protein F4809DRAFT_656016 [Biscogniauxia mediterranea]
MFALNALLTLLAASSAAGTPLNKPSLKSHYSSTSTSTSTSISITPHDRYSSSIGVLGCKINVNRVAYWPMAPDCDSPCVTVTAGGRSVNLLQVDQSGGAWDVSYDAWNYLYTGSSALEAPRAGGQIDAQWQRADASACADVLNGTAGRAAIPMSAPTQNWLSACPEGSWARANYLLYNIYDPVCRYGYDEECAWDPSQGANPVCPHQLGAQPVLTTAPVWNVDYPTSDMSLAL